MATLRSRVIHLAHEHPELRPHILPLLKKAELSLKREQVTIPLATGGTETMDALTLGPWSIYKNLRGSGYAVTFTPTGQAITTKPKTLMDAKGFLEAMIAAAPDLARANDTGDIMRHKDVIVELIKNPPALSGTAKKPPVELVSEKREKLIDELHRLGLASYGTRYGKAGEFFAKRMLGRGGDSPTRAISVGRKEVLKNEFYNERWGMVDSVLISAMTPELLKNWVEWAKEGPSRGDLRKQEEDERVRSRGEWLVTH